MRHRSALSATSSSPAASRARRCCEKKKKIAQREHQEQQNQQRDERWQEEAQQATQQGDERWQKRARGEEGNTRASLCCDSRRARREQPLPFSGSGEIRGKSIGPSTTTTAPWVRRNEVCRKGLQEKRWFIVHAWIDGVQKRGCVLPQQQKRRCGERRVHHGPQQKKT